MNPCPHKHSQAIRNTQPAALALAGVLLSLFAPALAAEGQAPAPAPAKKPVFPASVLVFCDLPCRWSLNGKGEGEIGSGKTGSAGLPLGHHQLEAETLDGLDQVQKEIDVTEKGQTVVKFELEPLRDARVALEQQANAARPAEQAYEDGQMLNAQQQYARARPLFDEACNGGNVNACASLGYMYDSGQGIPQDYHRASLAYQKACDGGVASSCASLGILYEYGHGVTQDYKQAGEYYGKGCDGGYASGCSFLGDLYRRGRGVPKDPDRGRQLMQKGCDLGDQWGCDELKKKP